MGTVVAIGTEAKLLDEDGNPPHTDRILVVDSVAAIAGGAGGVSSNTSYIESASGVEEGARTGLASVVTGVLFLLATFLAPLFAVVPSEAAAPALVIVGFLMMTQVTNIDWNDMEVALPAFLTIVLMPFTYNITVGIGRASSPGCSSRSPGACRADPPAAVDRHRLLRRLFPQGAARVAARLTASATRYPLLPRFRVRARRVASGARSEHVCREGPLPREGAYAWTRVVGWRSSGIVGVGNELG